MNQKQEGYAELYEFWELKEWREHKKGDQKQMHLSNRVFVVCWHKENNIHQI